jgi:hypothetical protein
MSYSLNSNFVPVEWYLAELWPLNLYLCSNFKLSGLKYQVNISKDFKEKSGQLQIWTKNTSSRAITQPNIIRQERNSNLNCNSSRYSDIPNIKSNISKDVKKKSGQLKIWTKILLFFDVLWYIDLIFDMWLYLDELQFKLEFRSGRMTFWLDNLKFEQKYKFKGHNSAKYHSTGTKFEFKL